MLENNDNIKKHRLSGEDGKKIVKMFETHYIQHIKELCEIIQGKIVEKCYAGSEGYITQFTDNVYMINYIDSETEKMDWIFDSGEPDEDDFYTINYIKLKPNLNIFSLNFYDIKGIINNKLQANKCKLKSVEGATVGEDTFNIAFVDNMEIDCEIIRDKYEKPYLKLKWKKY